MTSATRPDQSSPAVGPPTAAVVDRPREPPAKSPGRVRRQLHATLPGCWGALCSPASRSRRRSSPATASSRASSPASPRPSGTASVCWWRRSGAPSPTGPRPPRPGAWRVFAISAVVALRGVLRARAVLAEPDPLVDGGHRVQRSARHRLTPVAAVFFALLILVGRGLRGLYRWTVRKLDRLIGRRAATALGWILVVVLTFLVITGVLLDGLVSAADKAFSVRDTMTEEGVNQPASSLRSGGPGSVVPWDSLGRQGRKFTGKGPPRRTSRASSTFPRWSPFGRTPA